MSKLDVYSVRLLDHCGLFESFEMSGLSFRFRVSFLCVSANCVINLKTLKCYNFDISNFYGGDEPENPSIPLASQYTMPMRASRGLSCGSF